MKLGIDIQITLSVYCNIFGYLPIFHLAPSCWFVQYFLILLLKLQSYLVFSAKH